MKIVLSSCANSATDISSNKQPSDLEYADDVFLSGTPDELQAFLDHLNDSVAILGMRIVPSKCRMLLQSWNLPRRALFSHGRSWMKWTEFVIWLDTSYQVVVYLVKCSLVCRA